MSPKPLVSVITPTASCRPLIRRAIDSVAGQSYPWLEHVIVGDACAGAALSRLQALASENPGPVPLRLINAPPPPADVAAYRPARAAHARTIGVRAARGVLLAFLDEDNEYEPEHIEVLAKAIEKEPHVQAVHCWRQVLNPDGSPYLVKASPWEHDQHQAARGYDDLVASGVWVAGTHLLRDRLERNTVDSSCWLARKVLIDRVPFRLAYTTEERAAKLGEDVAFCFDLQHAEVPVARVPRYSVRYYLGGFSTTGRRDYVSPA